MLTQSRLRELLHYDSGTGVFRWLVAPGKRSDLKGAVAGSPQYQGYICICVDFQKHRAHRLAWLYMTGAWPDAHIDHINGDKGDNRFANLRGATKAQNEMNKGLRCHNTSGATGVYWSRAAGKWQAYIRIDGRSRYLGVYQNIDDAKAARREAEIALFGEYAFGVAA